MFHDDLLNVDAFKGFSALIYCQGLGVSQGVVETTRFRESQMRWHKKSFAGRTRGGQVVCRGRGGRVWCTAPYIDRFRRIVGCGDILRIVHEPSQNGYLGFSLYQQTGVFSYILAWQGAKNGSNFINIVKPTRKVFSGKVVQLGYKINNVGSAVLIGQLPIGLHVFNVEMYPGARGVFARAAGVTAKILQKIILKSCQLFVAIRLGSGRVCYVHGNCMSTVGQVSNVNANKVSLQTAGRHRHTGSRPKVRGVAMNPVDHPHGGGEGKTSGGRVSVSPWGRLTKGKKTLSKKYRQRVVLRLTKIQSSQSAG